MSIGGFGALRFAMLYPDQFGISVSLIGAIMIGERARDDQYYDMFHKGLYVRDLKGVQGIRAHFVEPPSILSANKIQNNVKEKMVYPVPRSGFSFVAQCRTSCGDS